MTDFPNVLIDGYAVNKVESSRFLGVVINSSLDWNNHINLINSKVSKTIGILIYVKDKLPDHILRSLYFTLVNPYYGRPLSVSGRPCYILPMFFIYLFIFFGRLILRPWLTDVRENFTRGRP